MLHMIRLAPLALLVIAAAARAQVAGASPAPAVPEPAVQQTHLEGEGVRIEELRVRGQNQRLVVHPKKGAPTYEVVPAEGHRDMSQDAQRGSAGRRVWNVINF